MLYEKLEIYLNYGGASGRPTQSFALLYNF